MCNLFFLTFKPSPDGPTAKSSIKPIKRDDTARTRIVECTAVWLRPQLSVLQVTLIGAVGGQEEEAVDVGGAPSVVPVCQLRAVHLSLGEARAGGQEGGPPQEQPAVARQLGDGVGEVHGGGVWVAELQVGGGDGVSGARRRQQEAGVENEGGGDAVAVLHGEV